MCMMSSNMKWKKAELKNLESLAVQAIIDAGKELKIRCPLDGKYKIGNNWAETH